jgi:hypothetical protein
VINLLKIIKKKGYLIINGKRTEELEIYSNLVEGKK